MPADAAFDTLAEAERLARDGIAENDAKAITAHSARLLGGVATKADIAELRTAIAVQRVGLRWLTGIGAGIVAILVGAFGFGFDMLVGMNADIAALQTVVAAQSADTAAVRADIATIQTVLAAQGADIAAIKESLQALAASQ